MFVVVGGAELEWTGGQPNTLPVSGPATTGVAPLLLGGIGGGGRLCTQPLWGTGVGPQRWRTVNQSLAKIVAAIIV